MSGFINVYEKDYSDIFFENFPVIIQKSRIMFDTGSEKFIIQVKLMNITSEIVEKVFLKFELLDSENNLLRYVDEHIVMSSAKYGTGFGEDSPLYENDKNIAACNVIITKVIFGGGKSWVNEDNSMGVTVSPASPIYFPDKLMQQFQADSAKVGIKTSCKFEEHKKCWRCSCGMLNGNDKKLCSACGANIVAIRECFSENKLMDSLKEKHIKEKHKKGKKHLITRIAIYFVIAMAMFIALYYYICYKELTQLTWRWPG